MVPAGPSSSWGPTASVRSFCAFLNVCWSSSSLRAGQPDPASQDPCGLGRDASRPPVGLGRLGSFGDLRQG